LVRLLAQTFQRFDRLRALVPVKKGKMGRVKASRIRVRVRIRIKVRVKVAA
jgi:hypothetical protein